MWFFCFRYTFTILANLVVFGCFWGLLENFNSSADAADLSPDDKEIFWASNFVDPLKFL